MPSAPYSNRLLGALLALSLALLPSRCGKDEASTSPDAGMQPTDADMQPKAPVPPVLAAPPLFPTAATNLADATEFLYSGDNPVQVGVSKGTIVKEHVAVLRGIVRSRDGNPLPGVRVSILAHPEFGSTLTRLDGLFDLAVNGGGLLTVSYAKDDYLAVQRQVRAPWLDYAWLPDVVLIPHDAQVTAVDLMAGATQAARGGSVTDKSGTRQATLLFQPGTQAVMAVEGSTQPLTTLHVRATEYTVGDDGPKSMPASLPATSGYTYAVELSIDEADQAGAKQVEFSKPVVFYVENFLNFPTGGAVPVGYYDRERGVWVPSNNGRVISILGVTGGLSDLDTDGDGQVDDAATLATLAIDQGERQRLAALYQPGQSLWRVPVTHFSPWDCNWPFGPPDGATLPSRSPSTPSVEDHPDLQCGSIIESQSQTLGEAIPVRGTPFSLYYMSDRGRGRTAAYTLEIPLSGKNLPAGLSRIELEVRVAGQLLRKSFAAEPDQRYEFIWDGKDAYGRMMSGGQPATVRIGYVYRPVYRTPAQLERSFAAYGENGISGDRYRGEVTLWREWQRVLGNQWSNQAAALGGFSLSAHHAYVSTQRTLYLGDGRRRGGTGSEQIRANQSIMIKTVAGVYGQYGEEGDGGLATETRIGGILGFQVGADGSLFFGESGAAGNRIRRVGRDGIVTTLMGLPAVGLSRLALGPDGSLYLSDLTTIRRLGPDGSITTVAGNGISGESGDGGPAVQASLYDANSIAVGPDGSLFIASRSRIRRVAPDGIITTIAGDGMPYQWMGEADGGPARDAKFSELFDLAVGPEGSLYLVDAVPYLDLSRIRVIGPDGRITTVAGKYIRGISGDGGPATEAGLGWANAIAVAPDGSIFITTADRVRLIEPDGVITTVAGDGTATYRGEGVPALQSGIGGAYHTAVGPDGSVYFGEAGYSIRRLSPVRPGYSAGESLKLPSEDGREFYVFDRSGRHLRTQDALTGALRYQFGYDPAGRLKTVNDGDGNITTVERDAQGAPTAIVAPYGQRTTLAVDGDGYLQKAESPAGESFTFAYQGQGGLLAAFTDPRGNVHRFEYDYLGRLKKDTDPAGGFKTLTRTEQGGGYTVAVSTAEGLTTTYQIDNLADGGQKRTSTGPSGLPTLTHSSAAGARQITDPDGTITDLVEGADPRFGGMVPLTQSITVTTPGGLSIAETAARSVVLNSADPFSLQSLADTATLNGRVFTNVYDRATATITATTPLGRQRTAKLDDRGRVSELHLPGLEALKLAYDGRGHIVGIGQGARSYTLAYDDKGYLASIQDPLSRVRAFERDAAGRTVKETLPDGTSIQLTYDASGNVRTVTPPGRPEHGMLYTPVDLLSEYAPPDVTGAGTRLTRYSYNLDRQLVQVSRPDGQRIEFGYDSAGRLKNVTVPSGELSLAYHALTGTLSTLTAPDGGTLTYGYDGGLLKTATWAGTVSGSVGHTYDNDLRIITESVNGSDISLSYDEDGLLTGAGALALTRDPSTGRVTGTTLGSVTDTFSYDTMYGEPSLYRARYGATDELVIQYTRDAIGRIQQKDETVLGTTHTYVYGYDTNGRLISVMRDGAAYSAYAYDANGNRTSYSGPGGSVFITQYDAQDRLLGYGTTSYTYTPNGELTSKTDASGMTSYVYDVMGNLTSVTLPSGTKIEYVIDGRNRRIGKKLNGVLVQGFLYGDELRPVAELDGSNAIVSRFVYGTKHNVPEYMEKGGATYRIITDHLGSPRLVINMATGAVAQQIDYDEFGIVLGDSAPGFQPFGLAGGLYESDTKLVRFGQRDYQAETGRWTAKDPIGFASTDINFYSYVLMDPINLVDFYGTSPEMTPALQAAISEVASDPGFRGLLDSVLPTSITGFFNLSGDLRNWGFVFSRKDPSVPENAQFLCTGIRDSAALILKANQEKLGITKVDYLDRSGFLDTAHSALAVTFNDGTSVALDWHATLQPESPLVQSVNEWMGK